MPIALCIEDLRAPATDQGRYLRCVALAGDRRAGLGLDGAGQVIWKRPEGSACELFMTADARLALLRASGSPPLRLTRAGRALEVPEGRPVILRQDDTLELAGRELRLHVHGETEMVRAPAPLGARARRAVGRVAAAVAVSAALGAGGLRAADAEEGAARIEVRTEPPKIALPPKKAEPKKPAEKKPADKKGEAKAKKKAKAKQPEAPAR